MYFKFLIVMLSVPVMLSAVFKYFMFMGITVKLFAVQPFIVYYDLKYGLKLK